MIERDGACISLWQDSMQPYKSTNKAERSGEYDTIIIGGGITGISTALLLQKAGKRCLVLEARNIGFGTTGGTTAHLNTLLDTPYATISQNFGEENAKLTAKAAKDAIALIKHNIKIFDIDCAFEEVAAFIFSQTEKQTDDLKNIKEGAEKVGLPIHYTKEIPVPINFEKAVKIEKQAKFHPLKYVYALAKVFEDAGGVIIQDARVSGVEGDDLITVTANNETYNSRSVIYATHIPIGINLLHLRCVPYRTYAMAVKLNKKEDYPSALAYDSEDPYHYYRSQEVNGKTYFIAGGNDHRTAQEENTERCFLELEAHVRKYFDVKEISFKWSSQYFEPADGLPYIGHLPGHPGNIYVATGFGGNGMIYSSVAALLLKSMLTGEENPYIALFDPNRVKPVAGFVNFIKHNAKVAGELLSKIWPAEKLHALAELAPGEAKVVQYEGESVALHKDEQGNIHAIHPGCSHMKCTVSWNSAEASWDCPCHGARFDADGQVLTGPAAMALDKIQIAKQEKHTARSL